MTIEQTKYLESIGIIDSMALKVQAIAKFYSDYMGYQVDDIFISEFTNKDGSRVYENLWFFNKNYSCEAKLFNTQEDYDTDVLKDAVNWMVVKINDFDIINNVTNDNSRMFLEFGLKRPREGYMKASKENCKQLSMILKKYIQPNFNITNGED